MMMMAMPCERCAWPSKGGQRLHVGGVLFARRRRPEAHARKVGRTPVSVRELDEHVFAFADDDGVGLQLLEGRARRRGRVRPDDDDMPCGATETLARLDRNAQLGRRATPEEITWGGGDRGELGPER